MQQNIGGLIDFFDMLVTRNTIPLINYGDTFDRVTTEVPLDQLLPARTRPVEIEYQVYNTVKKGALVNLAAVNTADLIRFGHVIQEMDAFRYDWKPSLDVADADPALNAIRQKFANFDSAVLPVATFLLGGFIFSGFAQASETTHYIQPKRARFFLGLTAAADQAQTLSGQEENAIFAAAEARLEGSKAETRKSDPVPPVLPYLLAQGKEPANVKELLERALAFRESPQGLAYRKIVDDIRADGVLARRAEDAVKNERAAALKYLAPYSKLDVERSRPLEVTLSAEMVGIPGVKAGIKATGRLGIPTWLRLWWNDSVPFGGVHKTLRRMWMAAESYTDLSAKLRQAWLKS